MKITFASKKVEKYFTDFDKLKKALPEGWVKSIKKYMDWFVASDNFAMFLSLNLGHPEKLLGHKKGQIRYSLHIAPNARLIIEPNATQDTIMVCSEIELEGVCDYHGGKENWYIP